MPQRTCETPACLNVHRAKGLCTTHYNRRYTSAERHPKVSVPCARCSKPTLKHPSQRYERRFCSLTCRDAWRKAIPPDAEAVAKRAAASRATRSGRRYQARLRLRRAVRGTRGERTWISGRCHRCGADYTTTTCGGAQPRWCSDVCATRASRSRRRARKRSAVHVPYSRTAVFERDGYRCHLCKRLTLAAATVPHPRAPVIDHLIPLGPGDDAQYNVATACFLCNSKRRDVGPAQLLLFG